MTADVFISYRGADRALARKLEQRLRSRWGSRVFRDETGLAGGDSWSAELKTRLEQAKVVLALVGPGWSVSTDETKEDWVRAELLDAVDRGTPILPVLVGDPDVLRVRLSALPQAFVRQAIVVPEDLPLSSLLEIAKRLRQLGAFEGDDSNSLAAGRADLVSPHALDTCTAALEEKDKDKLKKAVLVEGGGGSGRTALLRRLVLQRERYDDGVKRFVAVCGIDALDASRSTHAVMGAWLTSLARSIQQLRLHRDRLKHGHDLVDAVLKHGPDLLSRRVVSVNLLLALGDDRHDSLVLEATRRPTERWAPYPPRRLVIQAASVLTAFVEMADIELDLVVADVDAVDASSRDLIAELLDTPQEIRLVLAASPSAEEDNIEALRRLLPAVRADAAPTIERVRLDEPTMWENGGSPLPSWLARHRITLDGDLLAKLDEPNPYYALARLWYLADRGFVVEDEATRQRAEVDGRSTRWLLDVTTADVPAPTHAALLEHMIEEYIPPDLHRVIHAGALVGRTFPFTVAYDAATADPAEGSRDRKAQATACEATWSRLKASDPDGMVLTTYELRNGERYVTFALDDLVPHIVGRLTSGQRTDVHVRLAKAFATSEAATDKNDFEAAFRSVAAAAEHWERAGGSHLRTAADAHRRAAQFAERALAYREAEHHYRVAIRLLSQLIADTSDWRHDHEDLLIVSNCQYRLGQMVRLAGPFSGDESGSPEMYYKGALGNLQKLRELLRRRNVAELPDLAAERFARDDIPGPDRVQHLLRLCDALSGYIMLDTATWLNDRHEHVKAREALFDTLRRAELASGEASSRWLLAAASSRLAESLANEAMTMVAAHPDDDRVAARAHDLAVEALFSIERVVGLRTTTTNETLDLAEAKALAREVFGRIVTTLHRRPRLAEWVYRKLNAHGADVRVAEDKSTDFRLGTFLLSIVRLDEPVDRPGEQPGAERVDRRWTASDEVVTATELLQTYAEWARENGLRDMLGDAYNRLAVAAMLRAGGIATDEVPRLLARARLNPSPGSKPESLLLFGLHYALPERVGATTEAEIAQRRRATLVAFREALAAEDGVDTWTDDRVLETGWRRLAELLLPLCPALGLDALTVAAVQIGDVLNGVGDPIRLARQRAERHVESVRHDPALSPVHDRCIDQLVAVRLSRRAIDHKKATLRMAQDLFETHRAECETGEAADAEQLRRDLTWATYVYDWYDDVEPARLLVLAAEWHQDVTAAQWATPQLLRGPLTIEVLAEQFDARAVLGTERFDRIARLVKNRDIGSGHASPLEMVFFLAVELTSGDPGDGSASDGSPGSDAVASNGGAPWRALARRSGALAEAYRLARAERAADLAMFGRPLETSVNGTTSSSPSALAQRASEPAADHVGADDPAALAPTGP